MKFCRQCGAGVSRVIPEGDNRERDVCGSCGAIHYSNPRIIAGCVAVHDGHVLMCRRAIEPRRGLWTIPAGFMENGETVEQAAARETVEEANARVRIRRLHAVLSTSHISQVYMLFLADLLNGEHSAGDESLETRLCTEAEIPWGKLAFPTVTYALRAYYSDLKSGRPNTWVDTIRFPRRRSRVADAPAKMRSLSSSSDTASAS